MSHLAAIARLRARQLVAYSTGWVGLRRSDVWLATFPKTGSSWLRTIVANLITEDVSTRTLDDVLPLFGGSNLLAPWPHAIPRIIKTHQPYRPALFGRPERTLMLVRDPRDAVVSYHRMLSARQVHRFEGTLAEFVRNPSVGLPAFFRHYDSWSPHATVTVRYEALKADAAGEVRRALAELGAEPPVGAVEAAVQAASLGRMRAKEKAEGFSRDWFDDDFAFVGKGQAGGWETALSDEDKAYYDDLRRRHGFDLYT